jgi:hypothetical protein
MSSNTNDGRLTAISVRSIAAKNAFIRWATTLGDVASALNTAVNMLQREETGPAREHNLSTRLEDIIAEFYATVDEVERVRRLAGAISAQFPFDLHNAAAFDAVSAKLTELGLCGDWSESNALLPMVAEDLVTLISGASSSLIRYTSNLDETEDTEQRRTMLTTLGTDLLGIRDELAARNEADVIPAARLGVSAIQRAYSYRESA